MKLKNYIFNGILAMIAVILFAQCEGNKNGATVTQNSSEDNTPTSGNLKIAYVEVDSLLMKYDFWNDLNEMMMKKEENIRATLNQKMRELENDAKEFQRKIENGAYATRERAEQENARLVKKQQDLEALQNRLMSELQAENQKNNLQLRDSINSFLKIYNVDRGYDFIISNTGFDNLLFADTKYNITDEIIDGLNKRYSPTPATKK